jgi:hypothetical protein
MAELIGTHKAPPMSQVNTIMNDMIKYTPDIGKDQVAYAER